jgi:hypothetical protein
LVAGDDPPLNFDSVGAAGNVIGDLFR